MRLSLSVEDTNRLREKLGLKLIPTGVQSAKPAGQRDAFLSKLNEAAERLEERTIHEKAVGGDLLTSGKPVSTGDWLKKMNQLKDVGSKTEDESVSTVKPASIEKPKSPEKSYGNNSEPRPVRHESAAGDVETSQKLTTPRSYNDPLEAPSEVKKPEPTFKPARAIFKPKKLTAKAKARAREVVAENIALSSANMSTEHDEEQALETILARSRSQVRKKDTQGPQVFNNAPIRDDKGLTINSTATLLSLKEPERGKNDTNKRVEAEKEQDSGESELVHANSDNEEGEGGKIVSAHEDGSTQLAGVADFLKQLKKDASSSKPEVTSQSKAWAREISKKRKERELELLEAESMLKNLPAAQREDVMQLHRQRLAQEQAKEALFISKNYQPDVSIEYKDESGAPLDSRRAFKMLSREFHEKQQKKTNN